MKITIGSESKQPHDFAAPKADLISAQICPEAQNKKVLGNRAREKRIVTPLQPKNATVHPVSKDPFFLESVPCITDISNDLEHEYEPVVPAFERRPDVSGSTLPPLATRFFRLSFNRLRRPSPSPSPSVLVTPDSTPDHVLLSPLPLPLPLPMPLSWPSFRFHARNVAARLAPPVAFPKDCSWLLETVPFIGQTMEEALAESLLRSSPLVQEFPYHDLLDDAKPAASALNDEFAVQSSNVFDKPASPLNDEFAVQDSNDSQVTGTP